MNPWLFVFGGLLILILLLILTPIRYELSFAYHERLNLEASIRQSVFFSIKYEKKSRESKFDLLVFNFHLPAAKGRKETANKKPKSKNLISPKSVFRSILRNKTYRPLGKLLLRLFHSLKPRVLQIKGRYGFDEPHYTSWAYILFLLIASESPDYQIKLDPVWDEEYFQTEGFTKGSLTIAGIIWHLIRFAFSPSFMKFLIDFIKEKRRNSRKTRRKLQPST